MNLKMLFMILLSLSLFVDASNKTKTKSLCNLCECFTHEEPYRVVCNEMPFHQIPEIKDRNVRWMLELEDNSLRNVPNFIKYENLTSLSLSRNQISIIEDNAFRNLTNLTALSLSRNNLTSKSFTPDSFKGPYKDKLPNPLSLITLDLSHNQLNRLPESLFKHLPNLTKLDLSYNPFVDFSFNTAEAISELHNLQVLDISYTQLLRLPNHFFAELTSLNYLDLSGNSFVNIPSEINYIKSLRTLIINDNVFGALFENSFWKSLKNLETLHMSKSKSFFRIGDGVFTNLTSLRKLYLNDNMHLSILSQRSFLDKFNQTPHLKELHLQNNAFETLPEEALPWHDIRLLNLQNNPWNCDCNLEWLAKDVMKPMGDSANYKLSLNVVCASPPNMMGQVMKNSEVQNATFVCEFAIGQIGGYGFLVVATIVVGTLLLVTGTILFSYILFRRTKVQDWLGNNVKYRRTFNEDDEIITSTTQY